MFLSSCIWVFLFICTCSALQKADTDTLVLVHVLFRHGDRTPEKSNLDPTNPYYNESYYTPGYGQLTKKGQTRAYNIGKGLRERYGSFMGEKYNIKLIEGRSSDFNRTKDTLQVVFAGLFPPIAGEEFSPGINWQPIPYNFADRSRDKELFCFGCPRWDILFAESIATPAGKSSLDRYSQLFKDVNEATHQNLTDILILYYYYFGFEIQEQLGFPLPEWSKKVYPQPLLNLTLTYYDFLFSMPDLKRMAGGFLLRKIVSDTEHKINGMLTPQERKMFLYSGHENNIASLLELLNLRKSIAVPTYGSQVLIELHKINETYGIKIFYNDMINDIVAMTIPGFDEFVPFNELKSFLRDYIDIDDSICTGYASSFTGSVFIIMLCWIGVRLYANLQ